MTLHAALYRLTGGKLMASVGKAPVLLLETTGAKTGRRRTAPLLYLKEGDDFIVVASAGGSPRHPGWYRNLLAHPRAEVIVGARRVSVTAGTASASEKESLWPRLVEIYPGYQRYQKATERDIPVVRLKHDIA